MKYLFYSFLTVWSFFLITSCSGDSEKTCKSIDCSGHGTCVENEEDKTLSCNCDNGYYEDNLECLERFEVSGNYIIDKYKGLMWADPALDHLERDAAVSFCEDLNYSSFNDWYLPATEEAGDFHKNANAIGITPRQLFSGCLAEVTSDGYVKTKKGAQDYGGNPGDSINFSGAANVRCVRKSGK